MGRLIISIFTLFLFVNAKAQSQTQTKLPVLEPKVYLNVTNYLKTTNNYSVTNTFNNAYYLSRNKIRTSDFKNFYFNSGFNLFYLNAYRPIESDFFKPRKVNLTFSTSNSDIIMNYENVTSQGVEYKASFYQLFSQISAAEVLTLANVYLLTDSSSYKIVGYNYYDFKDENNQTQIVVAVMFEDYSSKKQIIKAWLLNSLPKISFDSDAGRKIILESFNNQSTDNSQSSLMSLDERINKTLDFFTPNSLFTFEHSYTHSHDKIEYFDLWRATQFEYFGLKIQRLAQNNDYETWLIDKNNSKTRISQVDVLNNMTNNSTICEIVKSKAPVVNVYELAINQKPFSKLLQSIKLPKMSNPMMIVAPNGKYALISEKGEIANLYLLDLQSGSIKALLDTTPLLSKEEKHDNKCSKDVFKEARFSDDGTRLFVSWVHDHRDQMSFNTFFYLSIFEL